MDRGTWQAKVHGVTKSQTQLSDIHFLFPESLPNRLTFRCNIDTYIGSVRICLSSYRDIINRLIIQPRHYLKGHIGDQCSLSHV